MQTTLSHLPAPAAALPLGGRRLRPSSFLIEPFDLFLHGEEQALLALQNRFAAFLRALDGPARFVTWHMPTSLRPLIDWTVTQAARTSNPWRTSILMEYRQWYEELERGGDFQQALCGLATWSEDSSAAQATGLAASAAIGTRVVEGRWPPLVCGLYRLKASPVWHLEPVGRPGGRPLVSILGSYAFRSVEWTFFRPMALLFTLGIPIAVAVDIPRTWEGHAAVAKLESVITAMQAHLVTSRTLDTGSQRQIADCSAALSEIHSGQALHDVQVRVAIAADDPVYPRLGEQIAHVIRLYETFLQRPLGGDPTGNLQSSLLSQALYRHYQGKDLAAMRPDQAPLIEEVVDTLSGLGDTPRVREIAREFAEEIAGLATGSGPYGHFLNGHTNVDFSIAGEEQPRIFTFYEMEEDEVLIAIAYTQVLAALMRTALSNDSPRIIAVDEVYRMMRHPSLLKFLINAVKTLRTRRKKVIVIDQQMRIFVSDPQARLLFENCPIRVIFAQRGGEDVFAHDPAFAHYTSQHRRIIAGLQRFQVLMETDEGIFYLDSAASRAEKFRYGHS